VLPCSDLFKAGDASNTIARSAGIRPRCLFVVMMRRYFAIIFAGLILAACSARSYATAPTAAPSPTVTIEPSRAVAQVPSETPLILLSLTPSNTPNIPTLAPTSVVALSSTPIPTNTKRPPATPRVIVTQILPNPPGTFGGDPATWTPPAPKPTPNPWDHFAFQRPIGPDHANYWARNYSYGSTDSGTRPVHHGIDWPDGTGTPILAAADGVIFYAGPDVETKFGPMPNFYGNVIVISHNMKDGDGDPVYTLYGHLSQVEVGKGETVKVGQEIGLVGSAGVAVGPHLHFEVRVGNPFDYNSTRNPELWIVPFLDSGVVAGRVADLSDSPQYGLTVELHSPDKYYQAFTYGDSTVNSDAILGENFVIPDVEPGYYSLTVKGIDGSLKYRSLVYVNARRVSFVDIHISTP
jgi:murein DD-endopeptidase MepM/ murein hydrolase activator NlpD